MNFKHGNFCTTVHKLKSYHSLIIGCAGSGKSLFAEKILEQEHNTGAVILSLFDLKDSIELGFAGFKPVSKYHLKLLKRLRYADGRECKPTAKKIRVYHPLTTNILKKLDREPHITRHRIPDCITFYTLPISGIDRQDLYFIMEREKETSTLRLILQAVNELKDDEGLEDLKLRMLDVVKRKSVSKITDATMKNVGEANSLLQFLENSNSFMPKNFELNLDIQQIFKNNDCYNIFSTKFLDDDKEACFHRFKLLTEIRKNITYAQHRLLLFLEEIRALAPHRSEDYRKVLANLIRKNLSLIRNLGKKGVNSISTSQTFSEIDEGIRNSATEILFGKIASMDDMSKLVKIFQLTRDVKQTLQNMKVGNFIEKGKENMLIKGQPPRHSHADIGFNFLETWQKNYPDNYRDPKPDAERHAEALKKLEKRAKQKVNRIQEKEREERESKEKGKQDKKDVFKEQELEKFKQQETELKEIKKEERKKRIRKAFELYQSKDPKYSSFRTISQHPEVRLSHTSVMNHIRTVTLREEGKSQKDIALLLKLKEETIEETLRIWDELNSKSEGEGGSKVENEQSEI